MVNPECVGPCPRCAGPLYPDHLDTILDIKAERCSQQPAARTVRGYGLNKFLWVQDSGHWSEYRALLVRVLHRE